MGIKDAKILIVEDEPQINRLIEMVLLSDGFYNIKKAFDGKEALEIIKKQKPDIVLLDVMIPYLDGFELCTRIKEDSYLKSVQVIMLTAKKMEEDILNGFDVGAVDYISKPFSNKILLARIKAHIKEDEISDISCNNLKIDDLKKTVIVEGNVIDLTKFEYEILKIFLSSKGVVFSRSKLLNYLKGDDGFNVSERAVDVQIVNLRKKLGKYANCIKTIRGIGYKFEEKE